MIVRRDETEGYLNLTLIIMMLLPMNLYHTQNNICQTTASTVIDVITFTLHCHVYTCLIEIQGWILKSHRRIKK